MIDGINARSLKSASAPATSAMDWRASKATEGR